MLAFVLYLKQQADDTARNTPDAASQPRPDDSPLHRLHVDRLARTLPVGSAASRCSSGNAATADLASQDLLAISAIGLLFAMLLMAAGTTWGRLRSGSATSDQEACRGGRIAGGRG